MFMFILVFEPMRQCKISYLTTTRLSCMLQFYFLFCACSSFTFCSALLYCLAKFSVCMSGLLIPSINYFSMFLIFNAVQSALTILLNAMSSSIFPGMYFCLVLVTNLRIAKIKFFVPLTGLILPCLFSYFFSMYLFRFFIGL